MAAHKTWTAEQEETLYRMAKAGYSAALVAQQTGKSRCAVVGKAWREGVALEGLICADRRGPYRRWTREEEIVLVDLWKNGAPAEDIAMVLEIQDVSRIFDKICKLRRRSGNANHLKRHRVNPAVL